MTPDRVRVLLLLAALLAFALGLSVLVITPVRNGTAYRCWWALTVGTDSMGYQEAPCAHGARPPVTGDVYCTLDPPRRAPHDNLQDC